MPQVFATRRPFADPDEVTSVSYKQAAHELRVTVHLLKWFTRYGALGDKLEEVDGQFDRDALSTFDAHLKGAWPDRRVPAGIQDELLREARGACVLCQKPCDVLEQAHVQRKGIEVQHYCQHPHNLVLLCPDCHSRYDTVKRTVTYEAVQQAKNVAISRLMEDVDRDIHLATLATTSLEQLLGLDAQDFVPAERRGLLHSFLVQLPTVALPDWHLRTVAQHLGDAAAIVNTSMPVTGSVLSAYSDALETPLAARREPSDAELWEVLDQPRAPGECDQCGASTEIEGGTCLDCDADLSEFAGHEAHESNEGWHVVYGDPQYGDRSELLRCPDCSSSNVALDFASTCGGCQHFADRAFDS